MKNLFKKTIIKILTLETKLVLKKYKPKIVAITGNVGKTTTKEAISLVLSNFFDIRKSEKSYNSDIGIPLTVLGLSNGWNDPLQWLFNILKGFAMIVFKHKYPKWLIL